MISAESLQRIEQSPTWRQRRVEVFDLPEGRLLVKGQRAPRGPWAHRWLNFLARVAGVPYLKAVPVHGGPQAQAIEVMRLQVLGAAGLPVPRVQHVAPQYFVMDYLGPKDLAQRLREQGVAAFDLWEAGLRAVLQVHQRGQYLSQCFARNLLVSERIEAFIDFEDDPLEAMTLYQAQARDWLAYLHSTLYNLGAPAEQVDAVLRRVWAEETPEVRHLLRHAAGRLSWLRWFPRNRKRWGKDFVSLQAVGAALHRHFFLRTGP